MSQFNKFYEAIGEIKDCLTKDLFGVSGEEETIDVEPLATYVTGILYPRHADGKSLFDIDVDEEELNVNDDVEIESTLDGDDDAIAEANKYKPSSMGVSVMLQSGVKTLSVVFECGIYRHIEEIKTVPLSARELASQANRDSQATIRLDGTEPATTKDITEHKYIRSQQKVELIFKVPDKVGTETQKFVENPVVEISLTIRKVMPDESKLVTVSAVNPAIEKNKLYIRNEYALFQCKLSVHSDLSFLPVYQNLLSGADVDSQIRALLYRTVKNYGYGHGCSVCYKESGQGVFEVCSSFIPSEEVLQMMPGRIADERVLILNDWKTANREQACNKLLEFVGEYSEWKVKQQAEANKLHSFKAATDELIKRIETCITRLKSGVETLRANDCSWRAFLLANEAMLLQRINTKHTKAEKVKWYPFQLAYILQIIPDVVNEQSEHRNVVDLLWFPTGGGKTEAYLGVAAFTIFFRRLVNKIDNDGVTIIMRYTLRLLTIQQFERAAALICACEYLRKKNKIGGGEISIGLWIGSGMTPNHIDAAKEVLAKLKTNRVPLLTYAFS